MVLRPLLLIPLQLIGAFTLAQKVVEPTGEVRLPPGLWADTVIVAFDPLQPIGGVRNPGSDKVTYLVLRENPAVVIERMLGPGLITTSDEERLVLKVNRLHLDEVGSYSICNLHAEVLKGKHGKYARVFERSILIQDERRLTSTSFHESNILDALQKFLDGYAVHAEAGTLTNVPIREADLHVPMVITDVEAPVLMTSAPKRGLYRNYMQMRMNEPDSLFDFELYDTAKSIEDGHMVKVRRIPDAGIDQFWGLSNGIHPYVRVGKSFIRLDRTYSGYEARVPQPETHDAGAIVVGSLFLGLVGAALAAGATSAEPGPLLCDLDLLCGELVPRSELAPENTYAMQVFQLVKYAKTDDPITLIVVGQPDVVLHKGEWTAYQLPPQAAPVKVTIAGPAGTEVVEMNTHTDRTEIHLVDLKGEGVLRVARVNEHQRLTTLHQLKDVDRRP